MIKLSIKRFFYTWSILSFCVISYCSHNPSFIFVGSGMRFITFLCFGLQKYFSDNKFKIAWFLIFCKFKYFLHLHNVSHYSSLSFLYLCVISFSNLTLQITSSNFSYCFYQSFHILIK